MGYIYQKFADSLCDRLVSQKPEFEEIVSFLSGTATCMTMANNFYVDALQNFKENGHYFGMYMSKVHEMETFLFDEQDEDSKQ